MIDSFACVRPASGHVGDVPAPAKNEHEHEHEQEHEQEDGQEDEHDVFRPATAIVIRLVIVLVILLVLVLVLVLCRRRAGMGHRKAAERLEAEIRAVLPRFDAPRTPVVE